MNPRSFSASSLLLLLAFVSLHVEAFNITNILNSYPNLIGFNQLLTQTKLANEINNRRTITVLALGNSSLAGIQGRSTDEIKKILGDHVILDYYDMDKLKNLPKTTSITTLYQTTGEAEQKQGFLNLTRMPGENFVFGSAVKDSLPVAKILRVVYTQPYNVSVLLVSQPIVAPGIGEVILPPPPPANNPPPAKAPTKSPAKSNKSSSAPNSDDNEGSAPIEAPIESPASEPTTAPPAETPNGSPPSPAVEDSSTSGASPALVGSCIAVAAFRANLIYVAHI